MNIEQFFLRKESKHPVMRGCQPCPVTHSAIFRRRDGLTMRLEFKARTGTAKFTCLHGADVKRSLTMSTMTIGDAMYEFNQLKMLDNKPAPVITQRDINKALGFTLPRRRK